MKNEQEALSSIIEMVNEFNEIFREQKSMFSMGSEIMLIVLEQSHLKPGHELDALNKIAEGDKLVVALQRLENTISEYKNILNSFNRKMESKINAHIKNQ